MTIQEIYDNPEVFGIAVSNDPEDEQSGADTWWKDYSNWGAGYVVNNSFSQAIHPGWWDGENDVPGELKNGFFYPNFIFKSEAGQ